MIQEDEKIFDDEFEEFEEDKKINLSNSDVLMEKTDRRLKDKTIGVENFVDSQKDDIENFPDSRRVEVENFPETQKVNVENFPEKQRVDVNFPDSQKVEVENFPEKQRVIIENFPKVQRIDENKIIEKLDNLKTAIEKLKFPEPIKNVSIKNLNEIPKTKFPEKIISDLSNDTLNKIVKIFKKQQIDFKELTEFFAKNPKYYLNVRLTDGREWYKAILEVISGLGGIDPVGLKNVDGTPINPAKEDGNLAVIAGKDFSTETTLVEVRAQLTNGTQQAKVKETAPTDTTKTNGIFTYIYDGNGNLTQIDQVIGAVTYRKTLSYDGSGNLTGMSVWAIV